MRCSRSGGSHEPAGHLSPLPPRARRPGAVRWPLARAYAGIVSVAPADASRAFRAVPGTTGRLCWVRYKPGSRSTPRRARLHDPGCSMRNEGPESRKSCPLCRHHRALNVAPFRTWQHHGRLAAVWMVMGRPPSGPRITVTEGSPTPRRASGNLLLTDTNRLASLLPADAHEFLRGRRVPDDLVGSTTLAATTSTPESAIHAGDSFPIRARIAVAPAATPWS